MNGKLIHSSSGAMNGNFGAILFTEGNARNHKINTGRNIHQYIHENFTPRPLLHWLNCIKSGLFLGNEGMCDLFTEGTPIITLVNLY